jgi:hypothetical protein
VERISERQDVQQRGAHLMKRDLVLIDLALQGGGSNGAFTWGVLDQSSNWPRAHIREITADVLLASACLPTMFRALRMTRESHCSRPLASVADAAFTRNCSPVSGVLA